VVGSVGLYVVAPEGRPWLVDLATAEASLRQHWPSASVTRQVSVVNDIPYLSFDVEINGSPRWGTLQPGVCLTLREGSPADWAETIVWFVSQLPAGSIALAAMGENPDMAPLPAHPTTRDVQDLYERLDRY
jgi:hypothetical protein